MEVIEDCEIFWIHFETLQKLYYFNKKYERLGRILSEDAYVYAQRRVIDMTVKSALQRYEDFKEKHSYLCEKIPQYHIASYLKISPQHLSTLKNSMKTSK